MNITVKEITSLEAEKPCKSIIHVKVVEKGAVTRYKKGGGDENVMASVSLADKTSSIKALVYDLCNLEMLHLNTGVQIQDFIAKEDASNNSFIVINRYTQVFMSTAVEAPQNILDSAVRIEKCFTTAEASLSPKKTTICTMKGIVTHVDALTTRKLRATEENVHFRKLKIRDESGVIPICLWRDIASTSIESDDCVQIKKTL